MEQVPGFPDCLVYDASRINNTICDNQSPYNTDECGFDGGDCNEFNEQYPDCEVILNTHLVGDGVCNNIFPFNSTNCKRDGGDCDDFDYPNCYVLDTGLIGNGECQNFEPYNTAACGYDGGDCLIQVQNDKSGTYIGIGVVASLGGLAVLFLCCFCYGRRRRRLTAEPQPPKHLMKYHSSHSNSDHASRSRNLAAPVQKQYTLKDAKKAREKKSSEGLFQEAGSTENLQMTRVMSSNSNIGLDLEAVSLSPEQNEPAESSSHSDSSSSTVGVTNKREIAFDENDYEDDDKITISKRDFDMEPEEVTPAEEGENENEQSKEKVEFKIDDYSV